MRNFINPLTPKPYFQFCHWTVPLCSSTLFPGIWVEICNIQSNQFKSNMLINSIPKFSIDRTVMAEIIICKVRHTVVTLWQPFWTSAHCFYSMFFNNFFFYHRYKWHKSRQRQQSNAAFPSSTWFSCEFWSNFIPDRQGLYTILYTTYMTSKRQLQLLHSKIGVQDHTQWFNHKASKQ
jgi:hypothetical protein